MQALLRNRVLELILLIPFHNTVSTLMVAPKLKLDRLKATQMERKRMTNLQKPKSYPISSVKNMGLEVTQTKTNCL